MHYIDALAFSQFLTSLKQFHCLLSLQFEFSHKFSKKPLKTKTQIAFYQAPYLGKRNNRDASHIFLDKNVCGFLLHRVLKVSDYFLN